MTDASAYLAAAIFLGFAVWRLSVARNDSTQVYIGGFALCIGGALLMNAPTSITALGELVADRRLPVALVHACKLGAYTFLLLTALALRAGDRGTLRRHKIVALALQVVSATLFVSANITVTREEVRVPPGHVPFFVAYDLLFAGYGAWCLAVVIRVLVRHARNEPSRVHRAGLRLMALSAVVGAVWTSWSAADIVSVVRTGHDGIGEDLFSTILGAAIALLASSGATATHWPLLLDGPLRWVRARRAHRALEPLWVALSTQLPEIALPATSPNQHGPRRREAATFALYRRVIEIRDAHLTLRPYFQPEVPRWVIEAEATAGVGAKSRTATSRGRPPRQAVLEAAAIAAALENRRTGHKPLGASEAGWQHTAPSSESNSLDAETTWLLQVADAFLRCPEVGEVRRRLLTTQQPPA